MLSDNSSFVEGVRVTSGNSFSKYITISGSFFVEDEEEAYITVNKTAIKAPKITNKIPIPNTYGISIIPLKINPIDTP